MAAKKLGDWTAYGGGGCGLNGGAGNQNWGFIGGVLQKQVLTNLLVGAEIYHPTALPVDGWNNTAGRSRDGPVDFQCYLAYQFTFDGSLFHFWNRQRR